jgi:hypothetical protein
VPDFLTRLIRRPIASRFYFRQSFLHAPYSPYGQTNAACPQRRDSHRAGRCKQPRQRIPKAKELRTKNSKAKHDYRSEIEEAPEINKRLLGTNTLLVEEAIAQGPLGIRQAQRTALKFARQFQQEQEDRWKVVTPWLSAKQSDTSDQRARACARFALAWRPKFLAALSMTRAPSLAAQIRQDYPRNRLRASQAGRGIRPTMGRRQPNATELLHSRCFQRAWKAIANPCGTWASRRLRSQV